jgi:hypothetical protein
MIVLDEESNSASSTVKKANPNKVYYNSVTKEEPGG